MNPAAKKSKSKRIKSKRIKSKIEKSHKNNFKKSPQIGEIYSKTQHENINAINYLKTRGYSDI